MNVTVIDDLSTIPGLLAARIKEVAVRWGNAPAATPEESLALSVLSQAVYDLRRFQTPTNRLERDLYRDAYDWLLDSDLRWPYSFVNICRLLGVPPETLRQELLADAALGSLGYWCKLGGRFARSVGASLTATFKIERATADLAAVRVEPIKP